MNRITLKDARVTIKGETLDAEVGIGLAPCPQRIGIEQAAHELGIKLPVRVSLHADLGQAKGRYLGVIKGAHRIEVSVGKTKVPKIGTLVCLPGRSETLWHELTHALQCERDYGGNDEQARHSVCIGRGGKGGCSRKGKLCPDGKYRCFQHPTKPVA